MALLAFSSPPAWAQDRTLNRTGTGARAAGMGNAFVAVSDDGTAASWNPAGLAQLRKPELALVHTSVWVSQSFRGLRSLDGAYRYTNGEAPYGAASLEFVSLAVPFDLFGKATTIQGHWHRQYDLGGHTDVEYFKQSESDGSRTPLRQAFDGFGAIDQFALSMATRLTQRFSLGVNLSFWDAEWTERYSVFEPSDSGSTDFATESRGQEYHGVNVNLGLMLSYPRFKVGVVYHAPFSSPYDVEGTVASNLIPTFSFSQSDAVFRIGESWATGLAWRPGGAWTIALDVTWDTWSRYLLEDCSICSVPVQNIFDGEPPDLTSTRDTTSFNLGAEHLFTPGSVVIPLRLGFAYEPQGPMDSSVRDPLEYLMVALGSGYNTNSLKLDAAVQYRWGSSKQELDLDLDSRLGIGPPAVGDVHFSEWRIKFSLIYRITDTDKLRSVFRSVFGSGEDEEAEPSS